MPQPAAEDDLPHSRRTIEQVATTFNVYFLLAMGLLSGCVFIAGLIPTATQVEAELDRVPSSLLLMGVGMMGFALFFPWFTAIYFARHFLYSVKRLERENSELRDEIAAIREGAE